MSHAVSSLFGGSSNAQIALLREQQAKVDAVEAGQQRLRTAGFGGMAYTDGGATAGASATPQDGISGLFSQFFKAFGVAA
jgi:hypothetical protein